MPSKLCNERSGLSAHFLLLKLVLFDRGLVLSGWECLEEFLLKWSYIIYTYYERLWFWTVNALLPFRVHCSNDTKTIAGFITGNNRCIITQFWCRLFWCQVLYMLQHNFSLLYAQDFLTDIALYNWLMLSYTGMSIALLAIVKLFLINLEIGIVVFACFSRIQSDITEVCYVYSITHIFLYSKRRKYE